MAETFVVHIVFHLFEHSFQNVNEVFIKQLEDETPELNFTGDYAKALKAMIDAQVQVLTKGADPQKALDEAAERLANETGRKIA